MSNAATTAATASSSSSAFTANSEESFNSQFNMELNVKWEDFKVSLGPIKENGQRDITIRGLRVQIPEPAPQTPPTRPTIAIPSAPIKSRPIDPFVSDGKEEAKYAVKEVVDEDNTEYVEAPPKYTWTDEHSKKSDKNEEWHHLLWNGLLKQFPFQNMDATHFGVNTFYESTIYINKHRFAHHNIGDLMTLYMELEGWSHYTRYSNQVVSGTYDEKDRRRLIITKFFIPNKIVWNPAYYHAYCEWNTAQCAISQSFKNLNRYQRMATFFRAFFQ
jgi:hypothetical protein